MKKKGVVAAGDISAARTVFQRRREFPPNGLQGAQDGSVRDKKKKEKGGKAVHGKRKEFTRKKKRGKCSLDGMEKRERMFKTKKKKGV